MNWIKAIGSLLGKFWTYVFADNAFVTCIKTLYALLGRTQQTLLNTNINELTIATYRNGADTVLLPFPIYLLKTRTETVETATGSAATQINGIHAPARDWGSVFSGSAQTLAEFDASAGRYALFKYRIPEPVFLSDHAVDGKCMLFAGADYDYSPDGILFHFDVEQAKLFDTVVMADASGAICTWYRLFGWAKPEAADTDMVDAIYGQELGPYSDIVWDIHQRGATMYNTKQLLCAATGSVVCEEDGVVDHVWTEQGYTCMLIGDKAYSHKGVEQEDERNFNHGDNVKQGDILFGSLRIYTGKDDIDALAPSDVPAIKVHTEAGDLNAVNGIVETTIDPVTGDPVLDTVDVDMPDGVHTVRCMPLRTDDDEASPAYKQAVADLWKESAPYVQLPNEPFNAFKFVLKKLRHGRSLLALLCCSDARVVASALAAIRKSIVASGIMTVYLRGKQESVSVPVTFTASCGNAAVATAATVKVIAMAASASVVL